MSAKNGGPTGSISTTSEVPLFVALPHPGWMNRMKISGATTSRTARLGAQRRICKAHPGQGCLRTAGMRKLPHQEWTMIVRLGIAAKCSKLFYKKGPYQIIRTNKGSRRQAT